MPVRVVTLRGSISAGAAWTEIARITVPSGERWTIFEIRPWATAGGAFFRIVHRSGATAMTVCDMTTDVTIQYKLPYPLDESCNAGDTIALEASNPTGSAVTITVEIVYRF